MLRPGDVVTALYLATRAPSNPGFEQLAEELHIGLASAHRSAKRLAAAGLLTDTRQVHLSPLTELLIHGVRYVFYAQPGPLTRGVPTAESAPPLSALLGSSGAPWVWPDPEGDLRGTSIQPLQRSVPAIARQDPLLYELLALVDALRVGGTRVRALAEQELRQRLDR